MPRLLEQSPYSTQQREVSKFTAYSETKQYSKRNSAGPDELQPLPVETTPTPTFSGQRPRSEIIDMPADTKDSDECFTARSDVKLLPAGSGLRHANSDGANLN